VKALYLLTIDAAAFFSRLGYQEIARSEAPAAITGTAQFAGLCPSSAHCMRKPLT
jgi:amino-acid N-acetyltransferase